MKDLNIRQKHRMECLNQEEFKLQYHSGKAHAIAGARSRQAKDVMKCILFNKCDALCRLNDFGLKLVGITDELPWLQSERNQS